MATQEGNEKRNKDIRKQTNELEDKINSALETKFTEEDSRMQTTLNELQVAASESDKDKLPKVLQKARTEPILKPKYDSKRQPNVGHEYSEGEEGLYQSGLIGQKTSGYPKSRTLSYFT